MPPPSFPPARRASARRRRAAVAIAAAAIALLGPAAPAAAEPEPARDWVLRVRGVLSGSSTRSDPEGYKAYSGIAVEAAAGRTLWRFLTLELSLRTESREIDQAQASAPDLRLGSLDLLPVTLMVLVFPWEGTFRPYAGAGANMTLCWEKTGALDDTQVSPSFGPALAIGVDIAVASALFLNVDVRWNMLRMDVSRAGARVVTLRVDPLTFGAGVAVRL